MEPDTYNLPYLHRGDSWTGFGPIQILLDSGDPFAAVATAATDLLTLASHGLSNGDILTVATTAGGLTAGRRLYVISSTENTFQLSLEAGGSAIDLTAASTHTLQLWEPPTGTLERVWIEFRKDSETGSLGLALDSEDTDPVTITIDDATNWIFTVPAQAGPATAGEWHYDIETMDDDDTRRTYIQGIMIVGQDVTRNTTVPA